MNLQNPPSRVRRHRAPADPSGTTHEAPVPPASAREPAPPPQLHQFDEKQLWRAMAWFVVPQTANAVLQLFSGTITAIYFGQLLGPWALAVASIFFPIFLLLVSFLIGVITGGIVLVGRAYGAGDTQQIKSVTGTTLCVCALVSIAIAAVGYRFAPELLAVMATPPDILSPAVAYARVTFVSLPIMTLFFAYTYLLRGTSDARTPFLATALCIAISLLLTPALIEGWSGLPKLAVTSAPWANLVACAISLPALMAYLAVRRHPMAFDREMLRRVRIDPAIARSFLAIGVPAGVQMAMASLSEVAVVFLVNAFGSSATAAYGAVNQVVGYLLAPMQGVALAATTFAAQAIGARRADRLGAITRIATVLNVLIGAPVICVICLFPQIVLSWFITDPDTLSIASRALLIALWSYLLFGIGNVLAGVMRSTGVVVWPAGITIAAIWLVQLPIAYLLSRWIGLDGIWIGYPAGFIAALLAQVIYYGLVWRHRPHQ
ncbi:putative MATE family efflux protein [Bradyrhizobium sp. AZCC 1578]|uniref:MATE family efflux transporter n=1 Tax=Bradyrhizobium sp. AZCC 1578 TaxID=3117027 RepID=UPI002FEEB1D3